MRPKQVDIEDPSQVFKFMQEQPAGLLMNIQHDLVQANYWQRPKPEENIFWCNFVGGVAFYAVDKGMVKKEELIEYVTKILNSSEEKKG